MITRITGRLTALTHEAATIAAGPFEYEVYIPEFVRRQLQGRLETDVSLRTIEYLEGTPGRGNLTPRLIGFMSHAEREFFDAICSVDGVGVKKALRSMVRPVREVAVAIEEQDVKQLSALPGIGAGLAERIIAKLRRKMAKFALLVQAETPAAEVGERGVVNDAYEALLSLGHSAPDARQKIEQVLESGKKFKSIEEILEEIYRSQSR
ncbi:MAG TPA: Holliday junction DNA helicase RuvA [Planctomycetaceae bacterium]|jgi:Holliday junction DNA helicase RuvA|nr:Holliday junction DNA helicase RuvA [Planctomycetaceae bacterium]